MDILFLLIPLSVVLVLLIMGVFAWAIQGGQFDDLEREGERIFDDEPAALDGSQAEPSGLPRHFDPAEAAQRKGV